MSVSRTVTLRSRDVSVQVEVRAEGGVVVHPPGGADEAAAGSPSFTCEAVYLGHGRVRLACPERQHNAYVVEEGETRWVFLDGEVITLEVDSGSAPRARRPATGHETLSAPMPATVVRVLAAPGDHVSAGSTLVVLEAMKMELPLRAPHDAVITAVHCEIGELVQPGVTLVQLDADQRAGS